MDSSAITAINERISDAEWHRDVAIGGGNTRAASYFLGVIAGLRQALSVIGGAKP